MMDEKRKQDMNVTAGGGIRFLRRQVGETIWRGWGLFGGIPFSEKEVQEAGLKVFKLRCEIIAGDDLGHVEENEIACESEEVFAKLLAFWNHELRETWKHTRLD